MKKIYSTPAIYLAVIAVENGIAATTLPDAAGISLEDLDTSGGYQVW